MSDLIDRQTAIETAIEAADKWDGGYSSEREGIIRKFFDKVPAVQPDHNADVSKKVERTDETAQNVQNEDLISRKWLVECIEEGWVKFDTAKDCNRMMHLVRDIAPSAQPEQNAQDEDLIFRKAAIEALARMMPRSYTPDGSHPADEEIFRAQEVFADCIEALEILPSAQPELKWIPCSERCPKEEQKEYWICTDTGYQCECRWTNVNHFWTDLTTSWHWHIMDVPQYTKVVAWMPLPEPYKEEDNERA